MLAFDADQSAEDIAAGLQEAASAVHTVLVTYAARDSDFDGHDIHAGEYLALLDGALVGNYTDFSELMGAIAGAAAPLEPEIISVYYGADVTENDAARVGKSMEAAFQDADVNVVCGGQPVYYYIISVE